MGWNHQPPSSCSHPMTPKRRTSQAKNPPKPVELESLEIVQPGPTVDFKQIPEEYGGGFKKLERGCNESWMKIEWYDCFFEMKISMKIRREGSEWGCGFHQIASNSNLSTYPECWSYLRISLFVFYFPTPFMLDSSDSGRKIIQTMHLIPLCEWFRQKNIFWTKYEEKNWITHKTKTPI